MSEEISISIDAKDAQNEAAILKLITSKIHFTPGEFRIKKRSIDARQRTVRANLMVEVCAKGETLAPVFISKKYTTVHDAPRVVIIGAGPAGLFAALQLIQCGIKPIIIERGKDVQARRRDLAAIHKEHIVNPNSNYCFGEGGAGTYSDGKLYTRSTKRGDVKNVLETLVQFGADENILVEAHPHIGTNKLPKIIASMREQIIASGGEVHFNSLWTDITIDNGKVKSITTADGKMVVAEAFIMATGHSARDVFKLLHGKQITIEFKPFALGVRAEHPQTLVDAVQYHCDIRPDYLPPAAYNLVHQVGDRGVYSFCMCPGGIIAPCATEQNEVVTNGWSPSKRNNPWANSGIVVPVSWEDLKDYHHHGPLAGMYFQQAVEQSCWQAAGSTQAAPAQRLVDFVNNKVSASLPDCSYQPGIVSANLNEILPPFIAKNLCEGFKAFGKKMKGYFTNEAVLVAPESRTSSPVRVPRHKDLLCHTELANFYPCAEGAGYAGGIVSAAIDGEKIALVIHEKILANT